MKYSAPLAPPPPYKSMVRAYKKSRPHGREHITFYAVRRFSMNLSMSSTKYSLPNARGTS